MTRRKLRQELDDVTSERDALTSALAELIMRCHDLETDNNLLKSALAHSLSGRDEDAWAIITEHTPRG
jgi:hypothetical protein